MKEHLELLGYPARDRVTGFEGVLTSLSYDLYGCIQFVITPKYFDNKVEEGRWFDSNRIEITSSEKVMETPDFDMEMNVLFYDKGPAEKPDMNRNSINK